MSIEDEWNLIPVLKRFNADDYDIVYALTNHLDKWADTYLEDAHKIKQGAFFRDDYTFTERSYFLRVI